MVARQGDPREATTSSIRAFWDHEAAELGRCPTATIRDFYFRILELHTLLGLLPRCSRLLDVGCGTGFGTLVLAHKSAACVGVDASCGMLEWARRLASDGVYRREIFDSLSPLWPASTEAASRVRFEHGDVLELKAPETPFEVVTAQRLLSNLATCDDQRAALRRLRACVGERGLLALSDTTHQGYQRTDALRAWAGLPALERHWHNRHLDEADLADFVNLGWAVEAVVSFDTYALLSKVVYPAACGEGHCAFLSGTNRAAMEVGSLFRSKQAVDEIGAAAFWRLFRGRVEIYDPDAAPRIAAWIDERSTTLPDWSSLGAHRLVLARACAPMI
jgi:SAM-dependent methyltransferase